jgi:hypothetical protein
MRFLLSYYVWRKVSIKNLSIILFIQNSFNWNISNHVLRYNITNIIQVSLVVTVRRWSVIRSKPCRGPILLFIDCNFKYHHFKDYYYYYYEKSIAYLFIYFLLGKSFKFVGHKIKGSQHRHVCNCWQKTMFNIVFVCMCMVYHFFEFRMSSSSSSLVRYLHQTDS